MKISEILHEAADEALWDGSNEAHKRQKWEFSCDAIKSVVGFGTKESDLATKFVIELGVSPNSLNAFDEFKSKTKRQAARYAWLKFAAMIAEEEGF